MRTSALLAAIRDTRRKLYVGRLPSAHAGCLPQRLRGYDWLSVPVVNPIGSVTHYFALVALGWRDDVDEIVSGERPARESFVSAATPEEACAAVTAALAGVHRDNVSGSAAWCQLLGLGTPQSVSA